MKNSSDLIAEIKNNAEIRGYKVQHDLADECGFEEITVTLGKNAWVSMKVEGGDFHFYDISCSYAQGMRAVGHDQALCLFSNLLLVVENVSDSYVQVVTEDEGEPY